MKKLLSVVAVFLCVVMTACGGSATSSSSSAPAPTPTPTPSPAPAEDSSVAPPPADAPDGVDDSWQKVLEKGELILGMETNFAPLGFTDDSGEIVGFEVEVANEVCNRLGITLVEQPIIWEEKEDDLALGKIDCVWNGMSITPQREKDMNLSEPYMENHIVFVVPADSGIETVEDLKGKSICVQYSSTAEELLQTDYADGGFYTVSLEDNFEALRQLELGFFDGMCGDSVFIDYWIATKAQGEYITIPATDEVDQYAIGFRKNDQALRDKIQETLDQLVADGTFTAISEKWFGRDIYAEMNGVSEDSGEDSENSDDEDSDSDNEDAEVMEDTDFLSSDSSADETDFLIP